MAGRYLGGSAGGFRIEGHRETFVLAGLANLSDAALVSKGTMVTLHAASPYRDRYGRAPVFAFAGARWLQASAMVSGARADPSGLPVGCASALLNAEPASAVLSARDTQGLQAAVGTFIAVRGRVRSVGDRERRLYLNFGTKWDEDFTISVAKSGRNKYDGDLEALKALEGRTITVRGALDMRGGPLIRLEHEARISFDD